MSTTTTADPDFMPAWLTRSLGEDEARQVWGSSSATAAWVQDLDEASELTSTHMTVTTAKHEAQDRVEELGNLLAEAKRDLDEAHADAAEVRLSLLDSRLGCLRNARQLAMDAVCWAEEYGSSALDTLRQELATLEELGERTAKQADEQAELVHSLGR